ncbi:hypothetical protein H0H93_003741, partial [Arthromyces matolae]
MMLESDGSFKHPKLTTGPIARIQYCMRVTFMVEMYHQCKKDSLTTYSKQMDSLQMWTTEKYESSFNSLRSLQHRASAIAEAEMALPQIWWTDRVHFRTLLFKGIEVSLDNISRAFVDMEHNLITKWETDVML